MAEIVPRTELLTGHTNQPDLVTTDAVFSLKVDATGGTYDIDINGETAAAVSATANAAALKADLVATGAVEADDVTVTGGPGDAGGTTPYVLTISDVEGFGEPTLDNVDAASLTGGASTAVVTQTQAPHVQAKHDTTVITDPNDPNAVQTPIAQQVGGLDSQSDPAPSDTLGY